LKQDLEGRVSGGNVEENGVPLDVTELGAAFLFFFRLGEKKWKTSLNFFDWGGVRLLS
jgi:hypothetical protein